MLAIGVPSFLMMVNRSQTFDRQDADQFFGGRDEGYEWRESMQHDR